MNPRIHILFLLIPVLALAYGCGGAPPPPPPLPAASAACAVFQQKAADVWNEESRNDCWNALSDVELEYASTAADYYITQMDTLVRDWTLEAQSWCEKNESGEAAFEEYAARKMCNDRALALLSAMKRFMMKSDVRVLDNAMDAFWEIRGELSCSMLPPSKPAAEIGSASSMHASEEKAVEYTAASRIALSLDITEEALSNADMAVKSAKSSGSRRLEAEAFVQMAMAQRKTTLREKALKNIEWAMEIYMDLDDRFATADLLYYRGIIETDTGDYASALLDFDSALDLYAQSGMETSIRAGMILNRRGTALLKLGRHEEAVRDFTKAADIISRAAGDGHPETARALHSAGIAYRKLGRHEKTIEYFEQELAIDMMRFGESNPDVAIDYDNIGATWELMGRYEKAIENYTKALDIFTSSYGRSHPVVALILIDIGSTWENMKQHHKAIEYYRQALEVSEEIYGKDDPNVASILFTLGRALRKKSDYAGALDYYSESLRIDRAAFGEASPDVASTYYEIGISYYRIGEYRKALWNFEKAMAVYKKLHASSFPQLENLSSWIDKCKTKLR